MVADAPAVALPTSLTRSRERDFQRTLCHGAGIQGVGTQGRKFVSFSLSMRLSDLDVLSGRAACGQEVYPAHRVAPISRPAPVEVPIGGYLKSGVEMVTGDLATRRGEGDPRVCDAALLLSRGGS